MDKFFAIEPEVAGGLGPHTVMDRSVHPPVVTKLHYLFEGWLGDEIVESFPCVLVTESLLRRFEVKRLTGMAVDKVEVSVSEQFREGYSDTQLPAFVWLKPLGIAGRDDFGIGPDFRLVVSKSALDEILATAPSGLGVEDFPG